MLLLRGHDPAKPLKNGYWFTIGGAIETHETPREAASRKLREDVGVMVDPDVFDQPIWGNTTQFSHSGVTYRQYQRFYSLRIDGDAAAISATAVPEGQHDVHPHRWWTAAELRTTDEPFYPVELPDLLVRLSTDTG